VTELRIYFEGHSSLRRGFHAFLREIVDLARSRRVRLELVAAKGDPGRFLAKAQRAHPSAFNVALLDSEAPEGTDWARQRGVHGHPAERVFWMVQLMEAWFLADPEKLEEYFQEGFNRNALKGGGGNVERIPKRDVEQSLKASTKNAKKGEYHKTVHAPHILARIRPSKVREAAPHCERLFTGLSAVLDKRS
jgi:hypothetical protein